jgi:hypothetical protein
MIGLIKPDHEDYARISEEMEIVEKSVIFMATPTLWQAS